ncbi:hypothetical protein AAFN60_14710 [Roseibacillus persicicus]|uniref:Uncharacterized protein n=1 Tax=Roseibacillus persicicus TaxID=454148 RepID=A0A918TL60_9BACT|nr:hypothetical protein [Roseibacillus persicicus]GHC52733.1 hypothetical protein GCM10007100_18890 [Roseibacillus persicicus]
MNKNSTEKNTYSVDEMMEKLREGDREKREEGELVTREDGTQVLRVKKRKRRSKQKKEEEAKRRKRNLVLRTFALIAIPLLLGLGIVLQLVRFHSPGFSKGVVAAVWEKTGANAKINRLSPLGTKVTAQSLTLAWPDDSPLEQVKATTVSGDLSLTSFVTGRLGGEELGSEKGYLLTSGRKDRKVSQPKGEAANLVGFKRYTSDNFSFYFGKVNSPFRLENSRVRFIPTAYSRQLHLTGGSLISGSWGEVPLKRGTIEFLENTMRVVSLRFEEEQRHLIFSGDLDLADSFHSLSVEVVEGNVGNVGGYGYERFFESDLAGSTGTLTFRPWNIESHEVTISAKPEYLTLKNLPFLSVLEELYGDARFQNFEFELENSFDIVRSSKGSEIKNLDLLELGILAVKGNLRVEGRELKGNLKVGLNAHKKLSLRNAQRDELFSKGKLESGFFWFDVELSGSVEVPRDNFSSYLQAGPNASDEDLFEQLTR